MHTTLDTRRVRRLQRIVERSRRDRERQERQRIRDATQPPDLEALIDAGIERANFILRHSR